MLPLRASVDFGAMAMKRVVRIPKCSSITRTSVANSLVSYSGHSLVVVVGGSYPSAEKQSVYSTALADWAKDLYLV